MPKYEKWVDGDGLVLIEGWARDGLTDEQISAKIDVSPSTIHDWKKKFPKFSETLKKGKEVIDYKVENELLRNALGYDVVEERIETSEMGAVKTIKTKKHIAGDTTAQIFWLKNRRPDKWRDKRDAEAFGNENIVADKLNEIFGGINNADS